MSNAAHTIGDSRIDWPPAFERTSPAERTRNNSFEVTLRQAIDDLETELERVGVDAWRLSTAAEHQERNPHIPYASANPADPGAVVRWTMDGDQYAIACDAYSRLRDNVREMGLYVREKRKIEGRTVVTGESEFANARLPATEEDVVVAREAPHEVLGVDPDADPAEVRRAYRDQVTEAHPDHGGDGSVFARLTDAKEAMFGR